MTREEQLQNACQPFVCPLSRLVAGTVARIKRLSAPADITQRLREIGICEEQQIKVISRQTNLVCLVCNARLGIALPLADTIFVEPLVATGML